MVHYSPKAPTPEGMRAKSKTAARRPSGYFFIKKGPLLAAFLLLLLHHNHLPLSMNTAIMRVHRQKRVGSGCKRLVLDVRQNEICRLSAYGRMAAAYVQSLGLKVVAAVLKRSLNVRPPCLCRHGGFSFGN